MLNKLQLEAFNVEESLESANQVLEKIVGDPSFYTEQRSQHLTVLDSKPRDCISTILSLS